jgi:hypothetical protein
MNFLELEKAYKISDFVTCKKFKIFYGCGTELAKLKFCTLKISDFDAQNA